MSIKSLDLEPTKENLLNTLQDDLLDRNCDVWRFAKLCNEIKGKCSVAINAEWGQGKTFFVRHVQMLIESLNPYFSTVSDEEKEIIKRVFLKYTGKEEKIEDFEAQVCVYYDAWANDNDEDPILSLIYGILKGVAPNYKFRVGVNGINVAALIADFFAGTNLSDFVKLKQEANLLAELQSQKEIFPLVNELIDNILNEQGNRLIVFIDELDRCKPDYAVRLLERIKHYFSNDRVTFVFSVNIKELQHTIKCHYGEGFDACRYLDRFFDLRISLPPANMEKYYQKIGLDYNSHVFERVCKAVIEEYGFGLRELEKFYRITKIAAYKPTHLYINYGFGEKSTKVFAYCFIVPIIIGLSMVNPDLYHRFIDGDDPQPILNIIKREDLSNTAAGFLLENRRVVTGERDNTAIRIEEKVLGAYNAIFNRSDKDEWGRTEIGICAFSKEIKEDVLRVASMLSIYTSYEQ